MINRETIFAALFSLASNAGSFNTKSRKLVDFGSVSPADQPAFFQTQGKEIATAGYRLPTKWMLHASLYVYVHQSSLDMLPSTALNNLIGAIELALAPDASGEQTLGGLVSHCRIVGTIETDEGTLGDQAVAIIPIEIMANA
ncbi:MAG TPA: hypothetical protein VIO35_07850 [Chloroflexota bacterium]|jgi:hypothetical protein